MTSLHFFILYIIVINIISFLFTGLDKFYAKNNMYRISEKSLFILAFILGAPGEYLAMQIFRHKTKHLKFVIGIPLLIILNIIITYFLVTKYFI